MPEEKTTNSNRPIVPPSPFGNGDEILISQLQNQEVTEEQKQEIENAENFRDKAVAALKTVNDPEIPVNIWDLGLIYKLETEDNNHNIKIEMTLTAPTCPVAGAIPPEVEKRLKELLPECGEVSVELVWDPPWDKDKMSEEAALELGMW